METLREYRRRQKLTLGELADRVGVSESQLSRIERTGNASLTLAARIEAETGVPASVIAQGISVAADRQERAA